eukprot:CAMPEP_0202893350 /NCGR_PEP_ID=MMETSP1392-20130828/2953_1 /ASSEMBLY_ACC=CAM_ASM_000868 /TAXON_ID=225041 /ORGANISM="Chlamydomonas chlamydogama, Strain SAG 11-48b" /LENGTH=40 /DNA_ID= /DNA_START= /DNA_END= /DNA_ORIENTATION=
MACTLVNPFTWGCGVVYGATFLSVVHVTAHHLKRLLGNGV